MALQRHNILIGLQTNETNERFSKVKSPLFVPMRRYGQLKNTGSRSDKANSTLRFLNCPCLALKQTKLFHKFSL